ncbi:hypothetical protein F383_23806 [Gossypium arboreum]|uniref:Uncharacterized protein n=1 Tax=Gossypium arboreum TaxID=29729 RepID=A0A0B0NTP4_GOSAR|nr:hypothetical protein F383_23806 [Gossypium arboreum]
MLQILVTNIITLTYLVANKYQNNTYLIN